MVPRLPCSFVSTQLHLEICFEISYSQKSLCCRVPPPRGELVGQNRNDFGGGAGQVNTMPRHRVPAARYLQRSSMELRERGIGPEGVLVTSLFRWTAVE